MAEDPLIIAKPALYGIGLNLNEFWRRFRARNDLRSRAARRFVQVFEDHGVQPTQIPRFLPEITLAQLDPNSLLDVISGTVLARTAELFGIRREWIEGVGEIIYPHRFCYKAPSSFFEELSSLHLEPSSVPVRALFSGESVEGQAQPLALILAEHVDEIGDEEIFRYRIFSDAWDWSHSHSRIQLKAMARVVNLELHKPVPLYQVSSKILIEIRDGKRVPRAALQGCLVTDPSLEDFGLSAEESAVAKETDELPAVLNYIRKHRLHFAFHK
jgi:hypothetical protein